MAIDRHTTFQSTTLQEELETYGYVILDLLSEEEVSDCVSFYQNEVSGFGQDDFLHTHMAPKEVKLKTHEFVKPIMEKRLNQLLADYKVGLGYYMIKPKHGKEPMRVHQDKSMVDETKYTGLIVWCPLVDVDENNGGLLIVDKSHRFISNHRGTDIDMPYSGIEDLVEQEQYSKPLRLKAGEAVIFDHRLWHASTSNTSKRIE